MSEVVYAEGDVDTGSWRAVLVGSKWRAVDDYGRERFILHEKPTAKQLGALETAYRLGVFDLMEG